MEKTTEIKFAQLLNEAISLPGVLAKHYSAFHRYSICNQVAAILQCLVQGIAAGPIATYVGWKDKGRIVQKGSTAIALCMPIAHKFSKENTETGETEEGVYQHFCWKKNWFVLSQTQGDDYAEVTKLPNWDVDKALTALEIVKVDFVYIDGNCQGYACGREIAISPLAAFPYKTLFHEIAHIMLGHTLENQMSDSDSTPLDIREVEAEAVAYLLTDLLDLNGKAESRGYIQHWLQSDTIPEKSARRIFSAADKILKAGN